ncbi:acyl-CoA dehydrogenase family protein [Amycolatopsis acidiphila]|uniref:Acyl-CoA dehydrogenase n=1 Tax=Amycolatopsis acidiphila TaxID=715473 RepID=A0A558A3L4_9PSEU|nr:acyl-CoA dehydrogenase family protein [Amycolatopsis acidiphila]TVT18838.1 acyl-CoA dehydrogenase [Amycolatopsis acidiphila]UIJ61760.1 acyl-CoA dehydrogenase family protein [Amycolatopsis acidiphila]GHG58021.1 glutaryl-CoA dehydrogenase [Amycolatopsis acidiphila]
MTKPDPRDLLGIRDQLTEEEREIADTVRTFVRKEVLEHAGRWFEDAEFPRHLISSIGDMGLLGMHLTGYGCAGTNATSYGLACLELEAGDSGLRSFVSVQGSLAMFPIWKYGSDEQKEQWLPGMARGEKIGCFGLTEPDRGSDPGDMRTIAKRDGSDWVLNGSKMWITNGTLADIAVVWARAEEGVRGFLVPTDTPGFTAREIKHKMSLRMSATAELVLEDVRLPDSAVLPGVKGLRGPLSCLAEARYGILWGALGAGRACYEAALDYAASREQFGKPIGGFQLTQQKLVGMALELNKGMLLALHLGRRKDAGELPPELVSFGKLNNVRTAIDIARSARTVLAANGISLEYPVLRHANNLESVLTYEGTEEIHTLVLGQLLTGQSAYR